LGAHHRGSLLYCALLIIAPMSGAVKATWRLGAYAPGLGVSLVVLAFRLKARVDRNLGL
jgi:hypothetical protein